MGSGGTPPLCDGAVANALKRPLPIGVTTFGSSALKGVRIREPPKLGALGSRTLGMGTLLTLITCPLGPLMASALGGKMPAPGGKAKGP